MDLAFENFKVYFYKAFITSGYQFDAAGKQIQKNIENFSLVGKYFLIYKKLVFISLQIQPDLLGLCLILHYLVSFARNFIQV
jgi:hypothetical protein